MARKKGIFHERTATISVSTKIIYIQLHLLNRSIPSIQVLGVFSNPKSYGICLSFIDFFFTLLLFFCCCRSFFFMLFSVRFTFIIMLQSRYILWYITQENGLSYLWLKLCVCMLNLVAIDNCE